MQIKRCHHNRANTKRRAKERERERVKSKKERFGILPGIFGVSNAKESMQKKLKLLNLLGYDPKTGQHAMSCTDFPECCTSLAFFREETKG